MVLEILWRVLRWIAWFVKNYQAVPCLWFSRCPITLVAQVEPSSVHVRLVDEWHWDTFFPQVLWFSAINIIPLVHLTHF
jgi:hypothetical protein